ncbi:putative membrane protein [Microcystis aeruginosa TAIHU98]|uniref:Putative membrane protein n=1 Tax=Microcystis aeruginosa TAIHU98 TaxID=1134457 RepID=L7ECM6_MICAE|nr:putative membrane protein [Microcystis aeruginosa TAIHU98]
MHRISISSLIEVMSVSVAIFVPSIAFLLIIPINYQEIT